jgi:RNA polymerase sigma factor (sigma-70 family)
MWAHMLRGFRDAGWRFADADHLHAFLVRVTRNRLIDRWRRYRTAIDREQPLSETDSRTAPESREPSPSEVAQAGELWVHMLTLCPPAHRDILRLRREGVAVAEIATRTGLHEGSVHRILHDLACRVAADRAPRIAPVRRTH